MTIQRNSNHILDLNRILKRKPHTFSTGDEIQVPQNTQKTYNVDTSNNFSVNTLDSNGLIKSTKTGGQNDALKNLADKNQPVPTSDGYFGQDGAYNKGKNVAGAISAVAGGLTGMYAGYKGNSTIADTSGVKKQANSIASNSSNAESNDALLNDMNSFNAMNNVSYGQVRGASNGDMAKNTLNSVVSGASAGSVAGPWGAAIGAVVGLGTGVAGIFSGNSKAKREKRRLNGQIAAANQSAINNFANTASNINTNTNINLGRNYFAQGGHVFAGGGKNDKYIDSNERYLMDYAQSKAYGNRLSKYTSDPNILNYAPNAAANELKSNFSSFVFPNTNNFDHLGETYIVNKNKFYTGYDKLPQYLKGVVDDRWNSQPKDVRYALENHDRVVSVPTLTYSNDFYDMMGVRHPDMFKPIHHETGHFLDPFLNPFLNNQYPEEYKLYLTPDVKMFKSNSNKEHDSKISENYADLMELRAKLHEANVFDSSDPNAVFDLKKLNEFRKYLKKQKQDSNFLNNHNDGQIINAINKIAYNDNGDNGNQNVFANGGHLFSTGGKYNTWWNPNDFNFALHLKPSTAHSDKVDNMLIPYLDANYKQLSKLVRDNNMSSVGLGKYVVSKLGLSRRFLIDAINACAWRIFQSPDDVSYKPSKNVTMTPVEKTGLGGAIDNYLSPNASYYIATTLPGSNVRFIQYVVKPKPLVIKGEPELVEPHQLTEPSKKVLDRTTQQWVDVPASWNYGDPYPQGMIHPVGLATSPQPNSTVKWKPTPNKVDDNSGIRFDTVNQEYFDKNNKIVGRDINNNTETLVSKPTTPKYQFKSYQDVLNNKPDELANKFADGGDIDEKKAVETPGQWERRYVNSPEFEKRYKSILYHGADVPSLQDIRDQVNNTHYLHVNFDNGMGSRQMVPLNVRTNVADTYDYGLRHKNEFELSHYVKPVGKGNPWIVEDTRPYPATADFTKDNVMPHEHGHVIDFNNYLSTAEYNDDGSIQPDPKYMFDANRKPIDKENSSISYSHDSKEAENYADINALKYNLYKFGIKDIANGDIVTIDDIRKFKDIINKMPVKQRNAYNRIFYLFDDDAIVRFLNKLADSNNHPDVNVPSVNVFAEGGDLDYDAIKQSYNDSNTGYSKFNHSSGWIKDYMRDHMKTGLVADGSVDAATMKGIKKANMNMNMFYTANGTDGEEMSNNVDYGWVKKNNPSQLYQYENQNLPTNGDKVQQSNLGSSTSSKAAKKAAPINVSKSKFYANIQQETKANPQLNETMSIAYNYLIKKGFKPVNASAIIGCIYAESRMNPQQDNGDHCGLLQWTKFKTENNKKKFGDRYNKLIEHTKQLEGDKYKDGDENLLLNQLAFIADDLRSKDFNNDKVKLIHTLSKSQSIYDSAKAIMEIYGGDDKDKYSPTERAAYALYCLKNISTTKQDNNKDKK